jgi:hypothetical protein
LTAKPAISTGHIRFAGHESKKATTLPLKRTKTKLLSARKRLLRKCSYFSNNWGADTVIANQSNWEHRDTVCESNLRKKPKVKRVVIVAKVQDTLFDVVALDPAEGCSTV